MHLVSRCVKFATLISVLKIRLLTALLGLISMTASAMPFADTVNHPFSWQIDRLRVNGIVQGYNNSIFRPDHPINRAEALKILMLAAFGEETLEVKNHRCFPDFFGPEQWYWIYACAAKERGIVEGYPDESFGGLQNVNTVEALKMSIQAWSIPLPVYVRKPDFWYTPYTDIAATLGVWNVLPRNPGHILARGEMAALMLYLGEEIAVIPIKNPIESPPTEVAVCGNGRVEKSEQCDDGNRLDGDGCSSLCIAVPEPVRHAALVIEQKSQGTSSNAQGSRDVTLMRFTALAGRQNVMLTGLKLRAEDGNLQNAKQYRLLIDGNGDDRPEKLVGVGKVENGLLIFSGFRQMLIDGTLTMMEVHADLPSTLGMTSTIRLAFATSDPRYAEATGQSDGRELVGIETNGVDCGKSVCWIAVSTATGQTVTVKDTGNLYVRKDSAPTGSHQLLLGDSGTKPLLHLVFAAEEEDIVVTGLILGGGTDSIDRLELFDREGGAKSFADARSLECASIAEGKFCAVDEDGLFTVTRGQEVDVYVYAVVKKDTDGGTSGDTVTLTLSSTASVTARGGGSQKNLTQNDSDTTAEGEIFIGRSDAGANIAITGSTHDLVAAKIATIENIANDPDQTLVPLGNQTFGAFRFAASPHQNSQSGLDGVTITELVFTVTATSVHVDDDSIELFNADNPNVSVPCTADRSTGIISVTCSNLDDGDISTVIEQGDFIDLALQGDIALIDAPGAHSLQASLNSLGDRSRLGTVVWEDDSFPFEWVDIDSSQVKSTLYRTP